MNWTKEPPSAPGWYWWRHRLNSQPEITEINFRFYDAKQTPGAFDHDGTWQPFCLLGREYTDCEWSGPLEPPE